MQNIAIVKTVIFSNEPEFLHLKLEKTKNIIKCNFRPCKNILLVDEESIVGVSKIVSISHQ